MKQEEYLGWEYRIDSTNKPEEEPLGAKVVRELREDIDLTCIIQNLNLPQYKEINVCDEQLFSPELLRKTLLMLGHENRKLKASRRKLAEECYQQATVNPFSLREQKAIDGCFRGAYYWRNSPQEAIQSWIKWSEE